MRLTEHFTREELEHSDIALRRGLENRCPASLMDNLTLTARCLEHIRHVLGDVPVIVTSGYRSPAVNAFVGGSETSKHMAALAADFVCPAYGAPIDIARRLAGLGREINYDQLILEGRWVHLSVPAHATAGRRELLTAHFAGGRVSYTNGIG